MGPTTLSPLSCPSDLWLTLSRSTNSTDYGMVQVKAGPTQPPRICRLSGSALARADSVGGTLTTSASSDPSTFCTCEKIHSICLGSRAEEKSCKLLIPSKSNPPKLTNVAAASFPSLSLYTPHLHLQLLPLSLSPALPVPLLSSY